jgi:outer membrane protein insertion porin family
LRALVSSLLVAVSAAASLAAQQDQQRVVRGLSFEGNRAIDGYTLKAAIATTNSSTFATSPFLRWMGLGEKRYFDELEFRRDVVRLLLLYRHSGYMNAVVDTVVRRERGDIYITFRISEGRPVRLVKLDVLGLDTILDPAWLKRVLPLQEGDPFNRMVFQASADTIVSLLKNRGYPYADVLQGFDVDASALRAEATLEGIPGPRMRIGSVVIAGAQQVDTATVRKMLSVRPHDLFRQDRLYQTQRDLYGIGVFHSVNVELADTAPRPGDSTVAVLVRVSEGPRHRVRVGAGYGSLDCFRLQSGWTAYDFLGGARALDVTGRVSKLGVGSPTKSGLRGNLCSFLEEDKTSDTVNYDVALTLRQPTFFSPRHTASLRLFAERRSEFDRYTRQAIGLNAAVVFNARRNVPLTIGYGVSVGRTTADPAVFCSAFRVCDEADRALLAGSRRFAALTISGVRDQVNSVLDPSAGSLVTAAITHASQLVASEPLYDFNRGQVEVSRYYPIGRRGALAWRVLAGTIVPARRITLEGQSVHFIPPDQRFYGGGPNSVRGYPRNELGPRVYVTDIRQVQGGDTIYRPDSSVRAEPIGGNSIVVLNAEARFATPLLRERMRVALFVDAGQVWERGAGEREGGEPSRVAGVRVTPGVGLRFATPLGPVRLDAAYNGYPAEPGPLYFQDSTRLTLIRDPAGVPRTHHPSLPRGFWNRIVVQFAVGQAF